MTFDAHKDRTALRLRLYENGFTPLANRRKMCLIKGWNSLEVTPDLINSRDWVRSKSFMDTGIRCGDVIALDWDIDDKDLLNDLLDAVVAEGLVAESPFVRVGMPPRELWVYRTAEKIGKRTTGHFMPPGAAEDHKGFAVEILGTGCQFAAYGQRDANTAYSWPEKSLLDASYMDLPEISRAQVDAIRDFCTAFFTDRGLERRSPGGGTDAGYSHVYDLTPDMIFDVQDMGEMSVTEIVDALRHAPEDEVLRCKVDALRPTGGSWAGMVSLVNDSLCLSDHGTYTSHFMKDEDIDAATAKLGALLAERFPKVEAPEPVVIENLRMDPLWPLDTNLAIALQRYVYVENDSLVCDLGQPFLTQKMGALHDTLAPFREVKQGPKGGDVVTRLSDLWREHHRRLTVATMQMRPDRPGPLYTENGVLHVNTYRPMQFAAGGDASVGLAMIANLLPIAEERQFFLQWLSYKIQHPEVPGPAVIMVARDSYGTGRGSLIALMTDIFGDDYVAPVDFPTLVGQGTQSQYNEWQSNSLLVVVDEAKETASGLTSWQVRSNAYEHLKTVVDPATRNLHIKRKGVKNTRERTYASIFIATNHADAFVIPANDRRIAVLENGQPMPAEYWAAFHAWRRDKANIGAFVAALKQIDLSAYNPYIAPPMTAAKAEMVEAGASDLDRAFAAALHGVTNTLVVKEQIILKIEDWLVENTAEVPDDWQRMVERLLLRKSRMVPKGHPDRVKIDGRTRALRVIGRVDTGIFNTPETVVAEVLRNGPVSRQVASSGKVVAFPQRG